jgi:hypothetical protein
MVGRLWELCKGVNCSAALSASYRASWDGKARGPCLHLGEVIDRLDCPCPARWVRACGVHGRCTINDPESPLPCCTLCPDHQEI